MRPFQAVCLQIEVREHRRGDAERVGGGTHIHDGPLPQHGGGSGRTARTAALFIHVDLPALTGEETCCCQSIRTRPHDHCTAFSLRMLRHPTYATFPPRSGSGTPGWVHRGAGHPLEDVRDLIELRLGLVDQLRTAVDHGVDQGADRLHLIAQEFPQCRIQAVV